MTPSDQQEVELLALLEVEHRARSRRLIDTIFPDTGPFARSLYPKHIAFLAAGATHRERAMMAGNRCGKSLTAAYELTCHATGTYPDWWTGKRFDHPVACWAAGESVRDVRDSAQKLLLGNLGAFGSGLIPGDAIARSTARSGTPDATDTIHVKHARGGLSTISFRTYEAGREAFQAATVHAIWLDEEPPIAIFVEALMRTATVDGVVLCTFTPLLGLSETAMHFLPDGRAPGTDGAGPHVTFVEWSDVPHLSEETKRDLLQSIPPYQRDARTKGIPAIGSGAIYPVPESDVVIDPFELPAWWPRAYGLDVGWNKTAAIWAAWDREADVVYLYSEHYASAAEPVVHAEAIKARGKWIQGVVDPAARGRSQDDGRRIIDQYYAADLLLSTANNAVESGLLEVWQRLSTGRLRVFSTLQNWLTEFRIYRRDERGKVVKERDHLMDATRYLCVSGVHVATVQPGYVLKSLGGLDRVGMRTSTGQAAGAGSISEYDPFSPDRMNSDEPRAIRGIGGGPGDAPGSVWYW